MRDAGNMERGFLPVNQAVVATAAHLASLKQGPGQIYLSRSLISINGRLLPSASLLYRLLGNDCARGLSFSRGFPNPPSWIPDAKLECP